MSMYRKKIGRRGIVGFVMCVCMILSVSQGFMLADAGKGSAKANPHGMAQTTSDYSAGTITPADDGTPADYVLSGGGDYTTPCGSGDDPGWSRVYMYLRADEICTDVYGDWEVYGPSGTTSWVDRTGTAGLTGVGDGAWTDLQNFASAWSIGEEAIVVYDKRINSTGVGYTTSVATRIVPDDPQFLSGCKLYKIPSVTFTASSVDWSLPAGWDAYGNVYGFRLYESTDNTTFYVVANVTGNTTITFDYIPVTGNWYAISVLYRGQVSGCADFTTVVESLYRGAPAQATDVTPPTITHTPETSAIEGEAIPITATITDDGGVTGASVFYRATGETTYVGISMVKDGDTYSINIPGSAVTKEGVEYYIWATDGANNATHPATDPETSPHSITVSAAVTTGTISGTVINSVSEEGIPGATVTAYKTGAITVANSTTAGSDGTYSMELEAGTYDVEASADGYETSDKRTENVTAGADTSDVNFALTAEPVDETPPTITDLLPEDASIVNTGTPAISANYTDPSGVNVSSVVLKVDDINVTGDATVAETGVSYTPAEALSEGEHTVYLAVKDASNKSNAANTTWSFTVDTELPVITHTAVTSATEGEKITINATITDNLNLTAASVFYRVAGTENYDSWPMTYVSNDDYTFDIPKSAVTTAGVEYYIWAKDDVNNATDGTAALPHSVSVSAVAPTKGNISGTVTDKNGEPISGVTVTAGGSLHTTDANGGYTITDLPAGTYTVTAEKSGYTSSTQSKTVTAGQTTTADFTLKKKEPSKPGFIPGIGIIGTTLVLLGAALVIYRKRRK